MVVVLVISQGLPDHLSRVSLRESHERCEAFDHLRLIPGKDLESLIPRVRVVIMEDLMEDPPYELAWIKNYRGWNLPRGQRYARDD